MEVGRIARNGEEFVGLEIIENPLELVSDGFMRTELPMVEGLVTFENGELLHVVIVLLVWGSNVVDGEFDEKLEMGDLGELEVRMMCVAVMPDVSMHMNVHHCALRVPRHRWGRRRRVR